MQLPHTGRFVVEQIMACSSPDGSHMDQSPGRKRYYTHNQPSVAGCLFSTAEKYQQGQSWVDLTSPSAVQQHVVSLGKLIVQVARGIPRSRNPSNLQHAAAPQLVQRKLCIEGGCYLQPIGLDAPHEVQLRPASSAKQAGMSQLRMKLTA